MPPVVLLFSSDEKACRAWAQALQELELTIDPCADVFAAVEWLISRSFDVILADCDSGPEAAFLLKNARELKLNRAAFTLAISSDTASVQNSTQNEEIGADLVLNKSLTPEQIKFALLANDRFLNCMKTWIGRGELGVPPPSSESRSTEQQAAPSEQPSPTALSPQPSPVKHAARPSPQAVRGTMRPRTPQDSNRSEGMYARSLRTFALSIVLVIAAYAFGNPLRLQSVFASLSSAYEHALRSHSDKIDLDEDTALPDSPALVQQPDPSTPTGRYRSSREQVVPVYPTPTPATKPVPPPVEAPAVVAGLDPEPHTPEPRHVQIPASLTTPPATDPEARPVSETRPPSLLGQVEPASLPEDLSRKLLLEKVQPSYPEQALKAGLQGAVVLQAWIAKDGSVRDLKLVGGSLLLGQAAVKAVKQWRYKPYLRNGVAVEAETYVTVNFRLP